MTPFAREVLERVRQKEHASYERWFQAIVDETLTAAFNKTLCWQINAFKSQAEEPCE